MGQPSGVSPSPPFAYQLIRAANDSLGLPRVLWLVYGQLGDVQRVIVDGDRSHTLPAGLEELVQLPPMVVSVKAFGSWVAHGLAMGILEHA